RRNQSMLKRVARYTVERWATDFVQRLADIKATQTLLSMRSLTPAVCREIVAAYHGSRRSLFLLDYDGTLREFVGQPEAAMPDPDLCRMLARLSDRDGNELVIISGRDRRILEDWLGDLDVHLVAEHGNWRRRRSGQWECRGSLADHWKDAIRPILDLYADRTPGSFVEEKDFSLVWHCRRSDPELAHVRMQELRGALVGLTENLDLGVFEGARILEVKSVAANKGSAAETWLARGPWEFIFCAGDDYTDEDMFAAMPEHAYTIKVGGGSSRARFSAGSVSVVRKLLENLAE
ncbi:MAG TPA: trehalose-phosphatase, partial [Phycisphaerales bacterium]|nr:trehalose-phosphatase [Phycisphaerales bacterium]